jgi:uncharacterized protein
MQPLTFDILTGRLAAELGLQISQVGPTLTLLDEQNTIPFIARYRKEVTGGLDEVQIEQIEKRAASLRALEARRLDIYRTIEEAGKLTPELAEAIAAATTMQALEDIYLPYRPKRRTRATIARERGLQDLADLILAQAHGDRDALAAPFVDLAREVPTIEDALAGARDIVAEVIAEDVEVREDMRELYRLHGTLKAAAVGQERDTAGTFAAYYDFQAMLPDLPPHRILAINRGEREEILRVAIMAPDDQVTLVLERCFPADFRSSLATDLRRAADDGNARLLAPSLEREMRRTLTERAEAHAITVFAANLRPLLLQPPLKGGTVLGIDPGYRTGCKLAVVDDTGKVRATGVIFPHPPQARTAEARQALVDLVRAHGVQVVAVGAGTASRETEALVAALIADTLPELRYAMVDEAGASVYSVSELAREEFPTLDATARSAISIARRMQDPLAELVKVDPRSIGVGLYQHDVDQKELEAALDRVVESAVNFAGVDANTASAALLHRVAGLNRKVAAAVVRYRDEHGRFRSRADLLKVPGLGPRMFQQAAGFLKIADSADVLDRTFIHPESYAACRRLIEQFPPARQGERLEERAQRFATALAARRDGLASLAVSLGIGEPTLADMLENLARPGLDPRTTLPPPLLRTEALSIDDLREGMVLQGTVRNVVDFGAFIDVGLKQAGLAHISELSDRFVRSPLDVLQVGQRVTVRVISVDRARGRIGLSLRQGRPGPA